MARATPRSPPEEPRPLADFVAAMQTGVQALSIEGEPGIGKTTLAQHVVAAARAKGFAVAAARVGRRETTLSYAALGDVLEGVSEEVLDALPGPQRESLEVALLRRPLPSVSQDPRAISVAALAVVRQMAADQPLLVVVDDVQWLDASSERVLSYIVRRLETERVGLLVTRRTEEHEAATPALVQALPPGRVSRYVVGPMAVPQFRLMLHRHISADLPRSVVLQIHALVEGNPFYGQEIAREVLRRGVPLPGSPLPVPADALTVVQQRVRALPGVVREVLTTAALTSRPTVELLRTALPGVDVETALAEGEAEHLIEIRRAQVDFRHPILATALISELSSAQRREVHRRLADAWQSPEEHALHLALSALEPDHRIAEALERAQESARLRGATAAAAEMASLALDHTPVGDHGKRAQRAVLAGLLGFEAGDAARALDFLRELVAAMPAGPERAAVMVTLCEVLWQDTVEIEELATAALGEPAARAGTLAEANLMLAWVWVYRGDVARARRHVHSARACADPMDLGVRADHLTIGALTSFLAGEPHEEQIDEAVELEDRVGNEIGAERRTVYSGGRVTRGLIAMWAGDHEAARTLLGTELRRFEAQGRYVAKDEILCYLAHLACRTGDLAAGQRYAEECLEIGEESGHVLGRGQNLLPRAWLAAMRGDHDLARRDAREGLELSLRYEDALAVATAHGVLGLVATSLGDMATGADHLVHVVEFLRRSGVHPPGAVPFVAEAICALVAAGRLDEAAQVCDDDRLTGRSRPETGAGLATVRGVALLQATNGDLEGAATLLADVLADERLRAQPFEHGRTLMAAGEVARRCRRRASARTHLDHALAVFERLGAESWSRQVHNDLQRLGTVGGPASELTPTELQVVGLVVEGLTNRQVADRLFVSVKTVEANLTHTYRKTGVRSRQEIVRWWLSRQEPTP